MKERAHTKEEQGPQIQFQNKLHTILYHQVSVENISSFADDALEQLVSLNEAVVHQYQSEYEESDKYTGSELEDRAYEAYGLENLNDVLARVIRVRDAISTVKATVVENLENTDTVITPPDATEPVFGDEGTSLYETPRIMNRLVTLAYILERDFSIESEAVTYVKGITTDNMLRQEPYVRVEIADLNRVVYVCDEEGNASYVFDTEVLDQLGVPIAELDISSKEQRNILISVTPEVGRRIIQSPTWRANMSALLREPFTEIENEDAQPAPQLSEFREKIAFLPYDEFEKEVRAAYEADGSPSGVHKWYERTCKVQSGWPVHPNVVYRAKGWQSFPMLVGKEVVELLTYDKFVHEVRAAYEAAGSPSGVKIWYDSTYKNQPGWPATPNVAYKTKGWQSYPELVGKEVVEFLEFNQFAQEVRATYEAAGSPKGVRKWYKSVSKNHSDWPAAPEITYNTKGWQSYPELVGKEVVEFLEFNQFAQGVRAAYERDGSPTNVSKWYKSVYKDQPGWPAAPEITYKTKGWQSYIELVGKEVVELLTYDEFEKEVRAAYEADGSPSNVPKWYKSVYKNQSGWPANPSVKYKKSWQSFPDLVSKN